MAKWRAKWQVDGGLGWELRWAIHLEVLVRRSPLQHHPSKENRSKLVRFSIEADHSCTR